MPKDPTINKIWALIMLVIIIIFAWFFFAPTVCDNVPPPHVLWGFDYCAFPV